MTKKSFLDLPHELTLNSMCASIYIQTSEF